MRKPRQKGGRVITCSRTLAGNLVAAPWTSLLLGLLEEWVECSLERAWHSPATLKLSISVSFYY